MVNLPLHGGKQVELGSVVHLGVQDSVDFVLLMLCKLHSCFFLIRQEVVAFLYVRAVTQVVS